MVAFTTLEALYAYVHTLRSFNGELDAEPLEASAPRPQHRFPDRREARMFHVGRSIWVGPPSLDRLGEWR